MRASRIAAMPLLAVHDPARLVISGSPSSTGITSVPGRRIGLAVPVACDGSNRTRLSNATTTAFGIIGLSDSR